MFNNSSQNKDRVILMVLAAHVVVVLVFSLLTNHFHLTWLGVTAYLVSLLVYGWKPGTLASRSTIAVSLIIFSAILIHLSGGLVEMHFHIFAALALLSIYHDWKVFGLAALTVALHHLVGLFIPLYSVYAPNPDLKIYSLHVLFVALESMALAYQIHLSKLSLHTIKEQNATLKHSFEEQTRLNRQLEAEITKNRVLLNVIPDALYLLDTQGNYYDAKSEMIGAGPLATRFNNLLENLAPQTAQEVQTSLTQTLSSGQLKILEYSRQLNEQRRDYELRLVPSGVGQVLAIERDITERKQVERIKNEFIGVVSHELRTPLTAIIGSLGLVINEVLGPLPDRARPILNIAYQNSERLLRLINDILDLDKLEADKLVFQSQPINLLQLASQALEANQGYASRFEVQLALEPPAQPELYELNISGDNDRLMQVLANLLSNAIKFSPTGSKVELGITQIQSGWVRMWVRDHGKGIPLEFQCHLFQKFFQADASSTRQKGGTGLGLYITRMIVEKHRGQIGFDSKMGKGTTFYFDLPLLPKSRSLDLLAEAACN
jgi:signal transduction histidine kinase